MVFRKRARVLCHFPSSGGHQIAHGKSWLLGGDGKFANIKRYVIRADSAHHIPKFYPHISEDFSVCLVVLFSTPRNVDLTRKSSTRGQWPQTCLFWAFQSCVIGNYASIGENTKNALNEIFDSLRNERHQKLKGIPAPCACRMLAEPRYVDFVRNSFLIFHLRLTSLEA